VRNFTYVPPALLLALACAPAGHRIEGLYPALPPTGRAFALGDTIVADPDSVYSQRYAVIGGGKPDYSAPVFIFRRPAGVPERLVEVLLDPDSTVQAYVFEYPATASLQQLKTYYARLLGKATWVSDAKDMVEWERGDLAFSLYAPTDAMAPRGYLRMRPPTRPVDAPPLSLDECLRLSPVLCTRP